MSLHKRTLLYIALLLFISIFLTSCGQAAEINVACDVGDLIDAINSANANSDPTKLILDPNCTYPFTSKDNSDGGQGPNSLPIITTKIIIEGNNATLLRDTGIGFRFFFITSSGSLRLEDITLEKGYAIITTGEQTNSRGGAIFNDGGAFRAVRSVFLDNSAWHGEGGAIYNLGILTLDDTTFEINFSNYGGAIFNGSMLDIPVVLQDVIFDRNFAIESGGAIYNGSAETDFFINRSQFKSNSSYKFHGGAIYVETGELEIRNSEFHTNRSGSTIHPTGDGGAIYSPSGDVTLIKTNFIADRAYGIGGTLYGGPGSTVKLREVVSEASDACHGGGSLYVEGETEILQSTFKDNRSGGAYFTWGLDTNNTSECLVGDGGAIYNTGTLTLDQSLVDGFSAETDGDGVYNLGDLVIINSTFNIYTNSTAEAINNLGSAEISFSTIVHSNLVNSGIMTVKDLIVANYTANCANSGSFTPMGENIALDASCPFSIILQSFSDLGISSSLSDNGGPTLTHLVEDTSPAIDMSDCLSASGIPIFKDQRDIYRPHPLSGTHSCDIGAFELHYTSPPPPPPLPPTQIPDSVPESSQDCNPFADQEVSLMTLNIRADTGKLPVYIKVEGGDGIFPGTDPELMDGLPLFDYEAKLGKTASYRCGLQGFPDRLYCMFDIPEVMEGTAQFFELWLNDCPDPVYTQANVLIPVTLAGDDPSPSGPTCTADLKEADCKAAGGSYQQVGRTSSNYECVCP